MQFREKKRMKNNENGFTTVLQREITLFHVFKKKYKKRRFMDLDTRPDKNIAHLFLKSLYCDRIRK